MNTGLNVNIQEFDVYDFKGKSIEELTFCMKEVQFVYPLKLRCFGTH